MQLVDGLFRGLRRTDTQAAVYIAAFLLLGIAAQCATLYAFVCMEAMEEADQQMAFELEMTARRVAKSGDVTTAMADLKASSVGEALAARLLNEEDKVERVWGVWPEAHRLVSTVRGDDARTLASLREFRGDHFLVGVVPLASSGERLELALPLAHSTAEAGEVGQGLLLVSLGSGVLALIIATIATGQAFRPLRHATELLQCIDARNLGERLPVLGTGDPVDRHAETLNRILENIDSAFSRLRAFSGDVAHELRTPINRIASVADVALLGDDRHELRLALETIQRTSGEMTAIVQSLLLIAEIDDGRHLANRETFDAESWIARSVGAYAPLFEERGTRISMSSDPVTLSGDRALLDRVLVNLLDNALQHASAGAQVEVHCRRAGDGVTICVEDSGPGISPPDRERVFERFVRLGNEKSAGGHGLGLALASAIARMHRGELSVETSALGGARFVWRFASLGDE